MKKIVLLAVMLIASMNYVSAGKYSCTSMNTNIYDSKEYNKYVSKIDRAFTKIFTKDEVSQKRLHSKIKSFYTEYSQYKGKSTKLDAIIEYLYCQSSFHFGQEWEDITHENMWNYEGNDYFFPDFKFSIPNGWKKDFGGDIGGGSLHSAYDESDKSQIVSFFIHAGGGRICRVLYSYCEPEDMINVTVNQHIKHIIKAHSKLDPSESLLLKGQNHIKDHELSVMMQTAVYSTKDKLSYMFASGDTPVTLEFKKYDRLLINRVFGSIEYDQALNNLEYLKGEFELKQNLKESKLLYNKLLVKSWKHNTTNYPYIADSSCMQMKIVSGSKYDWVDKSKVDKYWKTLSLTQKQQCISQYYLERIRVEQVGDTPLYKIIEGGYEGITVNLFDTETGLTINGTFGSTIEKVEVGKSGTYIQYSGGRGGIGGLILLDTEGRERELFKNNCNKASTEVEKKVCHMIIDFELLLNKKVEVAYSNGFGEKKEKIITLDQ